MEKENENPQIIAVEEVIELLKKKRSINTSNIMTNIFTRGGYPLDISQKTREDWDFTGLNVLDFVEMSLLTKHEQEELYGPQEDDQEIEEIIEDEEK